MLTCKLHCFFFLYKLKAKNNLITFENSEPTSQEAPCATVIKTNRLTIFRKIVIVDCGNHAERINKCSA